jgi:predicted RNA-binding protein YlqC (UPF0109 family)
VPSAETFRSVAAILLDHVPDGTEISAIEVTSPDAHWRVSVRTSTPGRVIGRRGATADAIRSAMAQQLHDSRLQLNIVEGPAPGDPPRHPPAGDREPREPPPAAPTAGLAMDEPNRS